MVKRKTSSNGGIKLTYFKAKGIYCKTIGGRKWYLGKDRQQAEIKALKIMQLWDDMKDAATDGTGGPIYLHQARKIARGKPNQQEKLQDTVSGASLHDAIEAWKLVIRESSKNLSWKNHLLKSADWLKHHHKDIALDSLGYDAIKTMGEYWLSLPKSNTKSSTQNTGHCIAPDTVIPALKKLRMLFDWLDATDSEPFTGWRLPRRYGDLLKGNRRDLEHNFQERTGQRTRQIRIFTLEELTIIWHTATEREQLYISLSLNTGATQTEIATLRHDEIHLNVEKPYIARDRHKTKVEGRFLLWKVTIDLLSNYLPERKRLQSELGDTTAVDPALAIVTDTCQQLVTMTKAGNNSDKVANSWHRVIARCSRKGKEIERPTGFKNLRKTGAHLIRDIAGDETASMFLAHRHTSSDELLGAYTNRDFSNLDAALTIAETRLAVAFNS